MDNRSSRLRQYLAHRLNRLREEEAQMISSLHKEFLLMHEGKKHKTPSPVRRCVAAVVNKDVIDKKRDVDDVPDDEKSKAFAVCWASYNKGLLKKGFGGKRGKSRKSQYKSLLKGK